MNTYAAPLLGLVLALPAWADPLTLTLADPQPDAASLAPGLAVSYAYGSPIKTLAHANGLLADAVPGPALIGLSYLDSEPGEMTLTSEKETKVAAAISGFIKFDAAGSYQLEIISNDGIIASIGGQQVALYDEVHACESNGVAEVEVPSAGWYALEATYFQRKGSSCLLMDWANGGEMEPVPDEAFAHLK
tara:strand:+ start:1040 stop:1609 length:570 start_codon:yes stop_codon:yes gene_type:complete